MGWSSIVHTTPVAPAIFRSRSGFSGLNAVKDSFTIILPESSWPSTNPASAKSSTLPLINAERFTGFNQPASLICVTDCSTRT